MPKKDEPSVIRSFPYWRNYPEPGQDLHDLEWGVMEVLSDKTLRFVETNPDPVELQELIDRLQKQFPSKKKPV